MSEKFVDEKRYIDGLMERVESLLSPVRGGYFNYVFSPYCRFPEVHAFNLVENDRVSPFSNKSIVSGLCLEFFFPWEGGWKLIVSLGGIELSLESDESLRRIQLVSSGSVLATVPRGEDCFLLSFRVINDEVYVSLDGRRLLCLGEGFEINARDIEVRCENGSACIIQAQTLGRSGQDEYTDYYNCDPTRKVVVGKCSPKWLLKWEKQSKYIYHTAVMSFVALNKMESLKTNSVWASSRKIKINSFLELFSNILASWDFWRPSESSCVENGLWERNNWSNGYLPGAFAVISKLLGRDKDASVDNKLVKCGVKWVAYLREMKGVLRHRFPDSRHWSNRSTNHGVVIYASLLFGAELIELEHPDIEVIKEDLFKILKESLEDGCYLEGLNYLQFIFLELTPLIWLYFSRQNKNYDDFISSEFPYFKNIPTFLYYASSGGKAMAKFGDCGTKEWIETAVRTISSFDRCVDLSSLIKFCSNSCSRGNEFLPFTSDFSPISSNSPDYGDVKKGGRFKLFSTSQMMGVKFHEKDDVWSVWVNGSKLHKTHNKDHDMASFFISRNHEPWVFEEPGRGAWRHNSWLIKGRFLENLSDEYSSFGDVSNNNSFLPRQTSGRINITECCDDAVRFVVKSSGMFSSSEGREIASIEREFLCSLKGEFYVLVFDRLRVEAESSVVSQFIFGSLPDISNGGLFFDSFGELIVMGDKPDSIKVKDLSVSGNGCKVLQDFDEYNKGEMLFARGFFSLNSEQSLSEKQSIVESEFLKFKDRFL